MWDTGLTGTGAIEVYPAATLKAHGIGKRGVQPAEVVAALERKMQLPLSREPWHHDFLRGDAMSPPDEQAHQKAMKEGWIWARSS